MAVLGGGLKRRERISARLGDILSHLYLASATLKRFEDDGRPAMDLPIVEWVIKDCLFQSEKAMQALLRNFPNRLVAMLSRIIIFPLGYRYAPPNDQLDHKLAKIMMTPSETRERIARGQYMTPSEHNPHGIINAALSDIIAAEPIFERLTSQASHKPHFTNLDKLAEQALADGKISQQEADILCKAEASRLRSINVDEFEYDALAVASKKSDKQKNSSPLDKEQAA